MTQNTGYDPETETWDGVKYPPPPFDWEPPSMAINSNLFNQKRTKTRKRVNNSGISANNRKKVTRSHKRRLGKNKPIFITRVTHF